MSEGTCEQRIGEHYKSRMETIGALVKGERATDLEELTDEELQEIENLVEVDRGELDIERINERAMTTIEEMPLSVEVIRSVKILLGWGGPGDWFECRVGEDNAIERIDYHFNDWFDHAEQDVSDDEDAAAFCQRFVDIATGNY